MKTRSIDGEIIEEIVYYLLYGEIQLMKTRSIDGEIQLIQTRSIDGEIQLMKTRSIDGVNLGNKNQVY